MVNNKWLLLAIVVLAVYLSPNIFFPNEAHFLIHDNLDSNVVYYKNLAESGKMFASNLDVIPNSLGGIPRAAYPPEYCLFVLLYLWFPALAAYNINIVIMHLVAFFGMYLLIGKFVFKNENKFAISSISLLFALLPFWPSGGLSIAGQPLLLYAFLNVLLKHQRWFDWLIICLFPFYSVLILSNLFFCITIFIGFIIYCFIKKTINYQFIIALCLFAIISVLIDYRLFYLQFIQHFESHRNISDSSGTLNFKGLIGVSILHFIKGQYHFYSLHSPFILISSFVAFLIAKTKKEKLTLLILISLAFLTSLIFVLPKWTGASFLFNDIAFLKTFALRFYALLPLLWFVIFSISISIFIKSSFYSKGVLMILFFLMIIFSLFSINSKDYQNDEFAENSFYNTYFNKSNGNYKSFKNYYKMDLFNEVKKVVKPKVNYIGCIGFSPEIAQFNGFYTVDGYYCFYPKKHNDLMNEITFLERKKCDLEPLGNRCYIMSDDDLKGKKEIVDLKLDFEKMKKLNVEYIFSIKKITDSHLINEIIVKTLNHSDSIFIYQISNKFLSLNNESL
jgi:hypothetical protein